MSKIFKTVDPETSDLFLNLDIRDMDDRFTYDPKDPNYIDYFERRAILAKELYPRTFADYNVEDLVNDIELRV